MSSGAEEFRRRLAVYLRLSVWLALLFILTYATTNWLAARRSNLFRFYWNWELGIPFVPWMIYIYFSINFFLALPLFVLDMNGIRCFAKAFAWVTVAAAVAHLLLPAQLGWQRPGQVAGYPVLHRLFALDLPYNLVPSLHVGYAFLAWAVVWNRTVEHWVRAMASVWLALLVMSVLLAHQHHLLDVVAGAALGVICYRRCVASCMT